MKTFSTATCIFAITTFAVLLPQFSYAAPAEPFKWYGLGGELTGESNEPRRWLGRLGISEDLGSRADLRCSIVPASAGLPQRATVICQGLTSELV